LAVADGSDDGAADSEAGDDDWIEAGQSATDTNDTNDATDATDATGQPVTPADDALLADLMQRIVYQDEAAFAALYRSLASRIFAQALRITRDAGCAEEVVEDVFWQVWRQAPRFDPARGCVLAWVRQIARSRALDALRAMGRNPLRLAVDLDDELAETPDGSHDDPARRLGTAQSAALVDLALAALDPLRRQLVALAFQRGFSQAEIAEQTGLPLGTVKSHIRRALALMKSSIEAAQVARPSPQARA
jgi:RNA polymerase sigma-70 factor (ECF subfamily)